MATTGTSGHGTSEFRTRNNKNLFQRQTVGFKMTSTPTEFHSEQLMEMSKNNQNFMKNIPKSDRLEYFAPWVNSEKTQYSVEGNFDIKSKKVCKYSLLNGPRKPYLFKIIKYKLCYLVWLFGGLQYKVYWKEIRSYCRIKSTSWRIITIKIRRFESNDPAIRVRCTRPYQYRIDNIKIYFNTNIKCLFLRIWLLVQIQLLWQQQYHWFMMPKNQNRLQKSVLDSISNFD